jgi:hypothetical protein
MKYLLSALCGIFLFLIVCLIFKVCFFDEKRSDFHSHEMITIKNPKLSDPDNVIIDMKVAITSLEEKISAMHTRFEDLYIFAGIIITLLLAINVTVYVRAESEVEKQIKGYDKIYSEKIAEYIQQAEVQVFKLNTEIDLIIKMKERLGDLQEPTIFKTEKDDNRKS